jgi:hypothetical protein
MAVIARLEPAAQYSRAFATNARAAGILSQPVISPGGDG